MDTWTKAHSRPDMVLGLGDNFYKVGVNHVSDPQFKRCWSDVFLKYESLRVPWRMILGNHDYMGIPHAQIDFHYDRKYNPDGFLALAIILITLCSRAKIAKLPHQTIVYQLVVRIKRTQKILCPASMCLFSASIRTVVRSTWLAYFLAVQNS